MERAVPAGTGVVHLSREWWWILVMGPFTAVWMLVGFVIGPGQDQSIFMVLGRELLSGRVPYLDLWDHKPPAIYVTDALAYLVPGDYWGMVWLFSVVVLVATGYVVWRMTNRSTAIVATALMATYTATQGGGMTETFATLPAAIAFGLAWQRRWFLAGVCTAIALLYSLQLVALLPALVILGWWRGLLPGLAGMAAGLVPALAGFVVTGSLPAAYDAVIHYSAVYTGLDPSLDVPRYLPFVVLLLLPLAPLALRVPVHRWQWAAAAWVIAGLATVYLNGRLFPHYVAPLIVPFAVLAAPAIRHLRYRQAYVGAVLGTTVIWGVLVAPAPY